MSRIILIKCEQFLLTKAMHANKMRIILNKRNTYAIPAPEYFTGRRGALAVSTRGASLAMPASDLWAGALSLLLIHYESGCKHSALNAALILDRLCESSGLDDETRILCERASNRLQHQR